MIKCGQLVAEPEELAFYRALPHPPNIKSAAFSPIIADAA